MVGQGRSPRTVLGGIVAALVSLTLVSLLVGVPTRTVVAKADDACPWIDTSRSPDERAALLLAASTLDQKLRWLVEQAANNPTQTVFGPGPFGSGATYASVQVPCTPVIQYTDGPFGVDSGATGVTAFPVPIAQTASWDRRLSYDKGRAQADEAFRTHRNVVLAPGVNLARTPFLGRNSEYMGEDPFLAGTLAAMWIHGLQRGNPTEPVEAVLKHFIANDQELDRRLTSSNLDARTLHELYGLVFEIAVPDGQPGGIMCSYNQVNGVYACENPDVLRRYLKDGVGFDGWVVSDFGAMHSTVGSLVGGT